MTNWKTTNCSWYIKMCLLFSHSSLKFVFMTFTVFMPFTLQKLYRNVLRKSYLLLWLSNLKNLNPIEQLYAGPNKLPFQKFSPYNSQHLKELVLISWHKISEKTFYSPIHCISDWVSVVLWAYIGPSSY